ncbi:3-deoxy-manno-octulosonate cytidylyltransferase [Aureimonas endophytica]|uniref:3-deoxy-manno-octulosonate cytidylyltransferase n=1 Tax=Aureimonas endophytica TaxID=2027858 RepID=A0A916ZDB1_9HYPH|nr:3-deoxy-manno-octulosonate cytidylyltransferase [Aureimonas endophytica]GGD90025.1 3-deoxy-manno-octulosonate cytidylyltransferase [Aureimonas endophytica]
MAIEGSGAPVQSASAEAGDGGKRAIATLPGDAKGFFAGFSAIVLVANSRDAAAVLAAPEIGERPIFVFFNRVYRILDAPFHRDCLLISRSTPVGSALVYRNELTEVLSLLEGPNFHGVLNMRARDKEVFSKPEEFRGVPAGFLDLETWAQRMYPAGQRWPSSGFALAVWLAQQNLPMPIYLSGFSGVREAEWRVFDSHDWTWEQIVLNLMYKNDRLRLFRAGNYFDRWPSRALMADFPEITPEELSTTAMEVLSHRLGGTNRVLDHIYSSLKPQLAIRDFLRRIRPPSRKKRTRDRLLAGKNPSGGAA